VDIFGELTFEAGFDVDFEFGVELEHESLSTHSRFSKRSGGSGLSISVLSFLIQFWEEPDAWIDLFILMNGSNKTKQIKNIRRY
jgi:hypothetical protein